MKKLIVEEFGPDYREIILSRKTSNTYAYLYVTKGIKREDILAFIGMRIYMGLHKYTKIDLYWNDNIIYNNVLKDLMPKHYFYLLSKALHFPEKEEKEEDSTVKPKINLSLNFFYPIDSFNLETHFLQT